MTHATAIDDLLAHASWAHALARRLVEDQAAADDVVQELWLAALRRPPERDRPLRPWIAGVVRKLAGRRRRTDVRRDARERAAARPEAGVAAADEPVARAEAQRMLVEAVLALEEPYRTTVLRRYFDGLEPAAIAAADGVPAGTVRWRLAAAREQLRQRLDAGHGHDARVWVLNLLPIATLGAPRPAVLLTSLVGSSALGGLVTMKMFWNAAAIVLLSLLGWVGFNTMGTAEPMVGAAGDHLRAGLKHLPHPVDLYTPDSASSIAGYQSIQEVSPLRRPVAEPPPSEIERLLLESSPPEALLARGSLLGILNHEFFTNQIPEDVRMDPDFRSRFMRALRELREERTRLSRLLSREVSGAVYARLEAGYEPGSTPRQDGELGSIVGLADGRGGWVPVPPDSPAYQTLETRKMWRFSATDFLLHMKRQ